MKQNIEIKGEIEFNQMEVKDILLAYAQDNNPFLLRAVDFYLKKNNGIAASKITIVKGGNDTISVKVEVKSSSDVGTLPITKFKTSTFGFTRTNLGFYNELTKYFEALIDKKQKKVEFGVALKYMTKKFPALTERKFYIYISDKRQSLKRGFSFDSKTKTFHF